MTTFQNALSTDFTISEVEERYATLTTAIFKEATEASFPTVDANGITLYYTTPTFSDALVAVPSVVTDVTRYAVVTEPTFINDQASVGSYLYKAHPDDDVSIIQTARLDVTATQPTFQNAVSTSVGMEFGGANGIEDFEKTINYKIAVDKRWSSIPYGASFSIVGVEE